MLDEERKQLFFLAKQAQLTRNEAADIIIANVPSVVLYGAFIRVLLEMQDHREDYIIARIGAIRAGEMYGGFSTNPNIRTDKYLELILPPSLSNINGTQYQLNSISNSAMTEVEFYRWLQMMQIGDNVKPSLIGHENSNSVAGMSLPTQRELAAIAERIRAIVNSVERHTGGCSNARQRLALNQVNNVRGDFVPLLQPSFDPVMVSPPPPMEFVFNTSQNNTPSAGSVFFPVGEAILPAGRNNNISNNSNDAVISDSHNNNNNDSSSRGHCGELLVSGALLPPPQHQQVPASQSVASCAPSPDAFALERELDLPTQRQIRQDIINKMNQHSVVFPKNISELKLPQLRLAERDMIEYLIQLRDVISSKQENCVVCMDHLPTVISLPCRHKVLCRLCAPSVSMCPVCRSHLFELFEPKEV